MATGIGLAADIAQRLGAKGPTKSGWYKAACPFPDHPDSTPSFGFTTEGYNCLGCARNGHIGELAQHLGIDPGDFRRDRRLSREDADRLLANRGLRPDTIRRFRIKPDIGRQAWAFPVNHAGAVKLKSFQGIPKYRWEKKTGRAEVYGLPGALKTDPDVLILVEGEPDVWIGQQAGLAAISFTSGASTVPERGVQEIVASSATEVWVLYDKDEPGRRGAADAATALRSEGLSVKILALPEGLPPGSDLTNLYNFLEKDDEALRDAVRSLPEVESPPTPSRWPLARPPGPPLPDALPLDGLPAVLRRQAQGVAASIQISTDLTVLLSLLAVSAAVGGKVEARIDGAWTREWIVLYGIGVLRPGERKSPAFAAMVQPIAEWESQRRAEILPQYRAAIDVVEVREEALRRLKKSNPSFDEVEAARLEVDQARTKVPLLPQLLVGDATPEALVERMSMNEGRAALLSPEGDPIRIADGLHSNGRVRLDELKKAWSGESIAPDRVTRVAGHVRRPALTLGLTLQPSVLETLRHKRSMRGEGFLARVLFARPASLVGTRVPSGSAPPLDPGVVARYGAALHTLLDSPPAAYESDGTPVPHALGFTDEALGLLYSFMAELEAQKPPGEPLAGICDWAEKAHGQAVRIAVVMALVDRADRGEDLYARPVDAPAMQAAVRLVRALSTHALDVLTEMGLDQHMMDLRSVWQRILARPEGLDVRTLARTLQGRESIKDTQHVRRLLDELEDRGCIRVRDRPSEGGRPPSPIIEVNPSLRSDRSDESGGGQASVTSGTAGWDAKPGETVEVVLFPEEAL